MIIVFSLLFNYLGFLCNKFNPLSANVKYICSGSVYLSIPLIKDYPNKNI